MNLRAIAAGVLTGSLLSSSAVALTVDEAVTAGCSTTQLAGLNAQIIAQGNCIVAGAYVELPARPNASFGGAVLPYLEEPARDALLTALDDNPGVSMSINSMLRTVAQQYLLYRWYQLGTCNIGLAASPGNSNHETGLAIDISEYNTWRPILSGVGFQWLGSSDPVHFDYAGPGAVDHRGVDVLAFQQLWNINNPTDLLVEDGIYGPQTEARLVQSDADGFAQGPSCAPSGELTISATIADADDSFDDGPSLGVIDLFEGERYQLAVDLDNGDGADSGPITLQVDLPDGIEAADGSTTLSVDVDNIAAGDRETVTTEIVAAEYTVYRGAAATIELSAATAATTLAVDVYSRRRWEWDSPRFEGWIGEPGPTGDAFETASGEMQTTGLGLTLDGPAHAAISMALASGSSAWLLIDSELRRFELPIPADDERHEVVVALVDVDTIDALALAGSGSFEVAYLRIEDADGSSAGDDTLGEDEGCACSAIGGGGGHSGWPLALLALVAIARPSRRAGCRRRRRAS